MKICGFCEGEGYHIIHLAFDSAENIYEDCPICKGSGYERKGIMLKRKLMGALGGLYIGLVGIAIIIIPFSIAGLIRDNQTDVIYMCLITILIFTLLGAWSS